MTKQLKDDTESDGPHVPKFRPCRHELCGEVTHRCSLSYPHEGPHQDASTGMRWEVDAAYGR